MVAKKGGRRGVWTLAAKNAVQLKITLDFITPQIWRRVIVPDNYSLSDLHHVIQAAMGWHDCHMHCFVIDGTAYTIADQPADMDMEDESNLMLSTLIQSGPKTFSYEYDFGDNWTHTITIEKTSPTEPDRKLPVCLAGERACPPEDCGSQPGYEDLIEAFNDESPDEDQEAMLEWLESMEPGWNPEVFDLKKINLTLQG